MQRTRLGQLLVALGLVALVASAVVLAGVAVVHSTSIATDAAPDLVEIEVVRAPIEAELARAVDDALPPGSLSDETAAAVAARIVRDAAVVDEIARAGASTHEMWTAGDATVLVLDPAVVTPATIAALRDIDLDLARSLSDGVRVVPEPIAMPITTTSAEHVDQIGSLARLVAIGGLIALVVGGVLDERRDRTVRSASTALLVLGVVLVVVPLVARLPDVTSWGWRSAVVVEMLAAAVVPLAVGGVACLGLGVFLRAVASQLEPVVTARIETRARDAITPPPAPTGAHMSKRKGKQVRQQAIDAFFGPEDGDESTEPDALADPATVLAPVGDAPIRRSADGFDRAVDAVESGPVDDSDDDSDDGADQGPTAPVAEPDEAELLAADRREALERLDGRRSRLRTHLPR